MMLGIEYSPCYDCDKTKCSFCVLTRYKDLQQKDEQIIKALECIAREEIKCAECAYGEYCYPVCQNLAGGDALDLIKRQKAEIEDKSNRLREILPMVVDIRDGAIKDFAERLTHTLVINNEENTEFFDFSYTLETIDNLVKEMIGEQ